MPPRIYVAPIAEPPAEIVQALVLRLAAVFPRVETVRPAVALDDAFNAARGQYESTRLLAALKQAAPGGERRVIGVTDRDLFIPILTFVFGEAQLGGTAAVASLYRLRNEFYGLPPDPSAVLERLVKECLHELGHTFGLIHCEDYACVMHASTSVEDIDLKGATYCARCAARVAAVP